jgi:hypothetical protein
MQLFWIHRQACFGVSAMTVETEAASNIEGKHNAVSLADCYTEDGIRGRLNG